LTFTGSLGSGQIPGESTAIAARGTDGKIYYTKETTPGAMQFEAWSDVCQTDTCAGFTYLSDPALFRYTDSTGSQWVIAAYTSDYRVDGYKAKPATLSAAVAGYDSATADSTGFDRFVMHEAG
ncbi:MAG TPA: hypothetical protein VGJ44_27525, partial [Kribbellaceae bacterium]